MDTNKFRHFDGAVHYYTEDEYLNRRDSDFNFNTKSLLCIKPYSEKLFKFNGNISVDMWVEFCSHFYAANPLVIEYFSGSYPEYVNDWYRLHRTGEKNNFKLKGRNWVST
jgi:hypothetical protein